MEKAQMERRGLTQLSAYYLVSPPSSRMVHAALGKDQSSEALPCQRLKAIGPGHRLSVSFLRSTAMNAVASLSIPRLRVQTHCYPLRDHWWIPRGLFVDECF